MIEKYYSLFQRLGFMGILKKLGHKVYGSISPLNGFPQSLHIEISNVCNLDCEYCVLRNNIKDKAILTPDMFELLRPYFKHVSSFRLSGIAEPLMNKHIISFIECLKKESPSCDLSIFSNATLLNKEMSEQLINCGLDVFEFSLDGTDSETVDSVRKGSHITNIVNNIKILRELKNEKGSQKPVIYATTVLQRKNYSQLPQIIALADELGVVRLNVNQLEPYRKDMVPHAVWCDSSIPKDLAEVLDRSMKLATKKKIYLGIASFSPTTPACNEVLTPIIMANGDVVHCAVLAYNREQFLQVSENNCIVMERHNSKQKCFGNIREASLKNIWFSHEYRKFRSKVSSGEFPTECRACLIKHNCICVRPGLSAESVVSTLKKYKYSNTQ